MQPKWTLNNSIDISTYIETHAQFKLTDLDGKRIWLSGYSESAECISEKWDMACYHEKYNFCKIYPNC